MYEILIPALAFLAVIFIGTAIITGRSARKERIRDRLEEQVQVGRSAETGQPGRLSGLLHRIGRSASGDQQSSTLRQRLAVAGYHNQAAPAVFLGAKLTLLTLGFVVLLAVLFPMSLSLTTKMFFVILGAAILFFAPDIVLSASAKKRRLDITHHLPDAVDLLEICVCSGMGLEMAWNLVAAEVRKVSSNLADEMALADLEIHLGGSRVDAMRHMADRTKVDGLRSLAAVLVQSERFGTSIADALRSFAAGTRERRSSDAEEAAEKMAVKLLLPMVLFVFPAILIVTAGPAALQMADKLFLTDW